MPLYELHKTLKTKGKHKLTTTMPNNSHNRIFLFFLIMKQIYSKKMKYNIIPYK